VAEVVGLELRNVGANYPFERSQRFPGIQPNSSYRDYSRLSCVVGDTQLRLSARPPSEPAFSFQIPITEKAKSWTLRDNIRRIVIPVSVGYGCDPRKVRATLLKVAQDNPDVMTTPAPSVDFDFGTDTLNFKVRVR
jgi:hypothetical protein